MAGLFFFHLAHSLQHACPHFTEKFESFKRSTVTKELQQQCLKKKEIQKLCINFP